ncbi:MAG: AAA family ATPase [Prochloraceae cyanobacterium]|nr:AAA family ATPase [Prochloraceae cyanobacterium]
MLPGYEITEIINEEEQMILYRGIAKREQRLALIKTFKNKSPSIEEIANLKQEYKALENLQCQGIIKTQKLEKYQNSLALILENFDGQSLSRVIAADRMSVIDFLTVAIALAEILIQLHKVPIIHNNIKTSNILIDSQKKEVKLTGFTRSISLSGQLKTSSISNLLEEDLGYISPEQTGRINRSLDYRTDFYSLGITFYEMLTGNLPFTSKDPIEIIHSHIAKQPISPEKKRQIPIAISNIVMKLLAKNSDDRYQSAAGLKFDLETCLQQLEKTGKIPLFQLGKHDRGDRFIIRDRLYGREKEVQTLLDIFSRVTRGATEIALISGYSGIGKTSIVNEIRKPIIEARGYFISGKFNQFKQNVPYAALIEAFRQLILQLLTESLERITIWKKKLLNALAPNARVIIDVIPEVELIIGSQPEVPQLGISESENRFNLVFQKFLNVFCQSEHPLVIFLDDLQWSDTASLNLIKLFTTNKSRQYLLAIGAYRDNEVSPTHQLTQTINQIKLTGTVINHIEIESLNLVHTTQLIAESLGGNVDLKKTKILAKVIFNKTQGNPFFLIQVLKSLYKENLLVYQADLDRWKWDIRQIQGVGITDLNIVELITANITRLPQYTQRVLKIAACIGNYFNLDTLAIVSQKSNLSTAKDLWPALQAGLILPQSDNYTIPLLFDESETQNFNLYDVRVDYKFLHDRVQQAAYCLIPDSEKKSTHYQIGKLLLENTNLSAEQDRLFTIVNQLNLSIDRIDTNSEKDRLAKLNFLAGQKAKIATAYQAAINYFNLSLELLGINSWKNYYQITYNIYLELAESEYLNTNLEEAAALCNLALENVQNDLERVKFYEIKIKINLAKNEIELALNNGIEALQILGVSLSNSPPKDLNIERLARLKPLQDSNKLMAMKILNSIYAPACFAESPLALPILYTKIELSRKYGNSPPAIYAYAVYSNIVAWLVPDIDLAYQLGELSLHILEQLNAKEFFAKAYVSISINITYKKHHIKKTIEPLEKSIQKALEVGDIEFACHAANFYCEHLFFMGKNLNFVHKNQKQYINFIDKFKQEHPLNLTKICAQFVAILLNEARAKELIGEIINETELIPYLLETKNQISIFNVYYYKAWLCYLFKDYSLAIENSEIAIQYSGFIKSEVIFTLHNFYYSLAILARYKYGSLETNLDLENETDRYWLKVTENQKQMKYWADRCPMNYQHKYDLIEAEKARSLGQNWLAQELYEKAIEGAKKQGYIQEEALAYERAAEFYLDRGREEISKLYLKNAYKCYSNWGANAKINALETDYPQLFNQITRTNITDRRKSISNTGIKALDLTTIIRAHQAFTSEIILEKLLEKLMITVIENAGAEKGLLILKKDDRWTIEAETRVNSDRVNILQSIPLYSINPDRQIPFLPTNIINYVIRSRKNIVIEDAINDELYNRDLYILDRRSKSILCIPLLDRGKFNGILYLENNLTTGAFTPNRVEVLKILASQAAISIENARLYEQLEDYSRNLEQIVERRTKELSQTVEILKATQAELIFENALLKNEAEDLAFEYQIGGSLAMDAPTYVVRSADRYLYKALKQGEFAYVFNARQMGKSSLTIRMMHHLQQEGFACAAIDMTRIGSEKVTPEQWYKGLAVELWRSFGLLTKVNLKNWWKERSDLSLVQRLGLFIEEVLLLEVGENNSTNLVIFIDEIDKVFSLSFSCNDFFALIRFCYERRNINPIYRRLTFALFGVAIPSDLISDPNTTPFNIGRAIELQGFKEHEAQPLLYGFKQKVNDPQILLKLVLNWTNGQPFLTQKICQLICNYSQSIASEDPVKFVDNIVQKNIIDNWESQDNPEHLKTIRDRIIHSEKNSVKLLKLYRLILELEGVKMIDLPEEKELLLSGIAIEEKGILKVRNRIYQSIFDRNWIDQNLQLIARS